MYAFPIVESIHVLTLPLSFGTIIWLDLRLMGLSFCTAPVSKISKEFNRLAIPGFLIMFTTGTLLFVANASKLYDNLFFRIKAALLIIAALNILAFFVVISLFRTDWDQSAVPPKHIRVVGFISLLVWVGVIIAGRLTAFSV